MAYAAAAGDFFRIPSVFEIMVASLPIGSSCPKWLNRQPGGPFCQLPSWPPPTISNQPQNANHLFEWRGRELNQQTASPPAERFGRYHRQNADLKLGQRICYDRKAEGGRRNGKAMAERGAPRSEQSAETRRALPQQAGVLHQGLTMGGKDLTCLSLSQAIDLEGLLQSALAGWRIAKWKGWCRNSRGAKCFRRSTILETPQNSIQ